MKLRWFCGLLLLGIAAAAETPRPGEGNGNSYKVLVMGDAHFDAEKFHAAPPASSGRKKERERNLAMWKAQSPALFAAAGKRAAAESVAFAVQLGDLIQGDCDNAELQQAMIRKGFSELKKNFPRIPLLIVKGNHDIRTVKKSRHNAAANPALLPIISKELGKPVRKNSCYSFMRGRDLYIAVDGFISARAIAAFVQKTLAAHPDTRYVFFMTHLPLLPVAVGNPFWTVPGSERIVTLLESRNTLILAAHTHTPSLLTLTTKRGKLTQLITSSMGHSWGMKFTPGALNDWQSYCDAVDKGLAKGGKAAESGKQRWAAWKNSGAWTFRHLCRNAGFVVLDVNGDGVSARVFINRSAKPGLTLKLLTAR